MFEMQANDNYQTPYEPTIVVKKEQMKKNPDGSLQRKAIPTQFKSLISVKERRMFYHEYGSEKDKMTLALLEQTVTPEGEPLIKNDQDKEYVLQNANAILPISQPILTPPETDFVEKEFGDKIIDLKYPTADQREVLLPCSINCRVPTPLELEEQKQQIKAQNKSNKLANKYQQERNGEIPYTDYAAKFHPDVCRTFDNLDDIPAGDLGKLEVLFFL
jgi:hypothetical protein